MSTFDNWDKVSLKGGFNCLKILLRLRFCHCYYRQFSKTNHYAVIVLLFHLIFMTNR